MQRLPQTLPDFNQANILVVGDVMLDRYWFGETSRISPEAPVPVVKVNAIDNRPGGAGNVALNLAALEANVTLIGITGKDEASKHLKEQLTAAQVKHDLIELDHLATIVKLRVLSRHQQLIRLDFEDPLMLSEASLLEERVKAHLPHIDLLILSDYQKGTLQNPKRLIELAKAAGVKVLVDPKGSDFSIYANADMVTPNFKEFEAVAGHCANEKDILEKGHALIKAHGIHNLLITRGESGMTLIEPNHHSHLPAYAKEVFDVTGAGDTVIATLGACLATNLDPIDAMALANLAASLVVNKLGAATVSVPELQVALTGRTTFLSGIVNDEQLVQAVKEIKAQGKKVVFTNGCYDILHAGHVASLQMAKDLGDFLVVAVNNDESIRKLKGPNRPINHLEHRMTVLASLGMVDCVVPFGDDTPERLLRLIQPDLLVKGGDYRIDQVVGADIVYSYGGEVRIMNHGIRTSSTALLKRLQENEESGSVAS